MSLYSTLFFEKTEEKFSSLTNDLINLIPEKVSCTYVERSDNDSCISSDLLFIIFEHSILIGPIMEEEECCKGKFGVDVKHKWYNRQH